MAAECVLCDWQLDILAAPLCAYLPGSTLPLRWSPDSPDYVRTVRADEGIAETIKDVALVAHWAQEHREQLRAIVGDVELGYGPIRELSKRPDR